MITDPLLIVAVLSVCVVVSELLCRHTAARHGGTALVVIIVTALVANLGIIPAGSTEDAPVPVYDDTFAYLAPLAIFWLVLRVDLRRAFTVGGPLLVCFGLGALGTVLGVMAGLSVVDTAVIGEQSPAIAGMFAATYIGGSANFNAIALHYGVVKEGMLYAGCVTVDAGMTALWMVVNIGLPRLSSMRPGRVEPVPEGPSRDPDEESVAPLHLGILVALGAACLWGATAASTWLGARGISIPAMLLLTAFALVLGQLPVIARLRGMNVLAMYAVYVFLAVIGAFCDFAALASLGSLGLQLTIFASVLLAVHGVVIYGGSRLLGYDMDAASIASQANIGGGTTALAVARSLGRPELVLPAILVGAIGTATGTFVGFALAAQLAG